MNLIYKLLALPHFAANIKPGSPCSGNPILGIPSWYQYLPGTRTTAGVCSPQFTSIADAWLIVAAVIEILLRIAAVIAVGIIIYAGVEYSTSQGKPEQTSRALNTIIAAAVGMVICIMGAVVVTFIAGSFN